MKVLGAGLAVAHVPLDATHMCVSQQQNVEHDGGEGAPAGPKEKPKENPRNRIESREKGATFAGRLCRVRVKVPRILPAFPVRK